jgi:hypothetical protein
MTNYRNDRVRTLPLDFHPDDLALHGVAAMCSHYSIGQATIMPKPRKLEEILVEEIKFEDEAGTVLHYRQRDLVRDTGLKLVGNPQPWR